MSETQVLEQIKGKLLNSKRILINCHHNPDADSVAGAQATRLVLQGLGKDVKVVSPSQIPANLKFLETYGEIEVVDFKKFEYSDFDVFLTLDSASWNRVSGAHDIEKPAVFLISVDHHQSNQKFADLNYVEPDTAANCQILYNMFLSWNVEITKDIATCLLAGIIGDSGGLRYPEADIKTYEAATNLMKLEADKNTIIYNLYQSYSFETILIWKSVLENIEKVDNFVWSSVPLNSEIKNQTGVKSEIADLVFQNVLDTDFGFIIIEEPDSTAVSFRARNKVDVSILASKLGGGGHKWAAAARLNLPFEEAVQKILEAAKEFSKQNERN